MGDSQAAACTRGAVVELLVDKPAAGGRMLARHDGQVVLVSGAIPGERARVRIERVGKGVAFGETIAVLEPSADRRPAADAGCGGNAFAHVAYPRQVALKAEIIQDAFGRIGRVPLGTAPTVVTSPETGYRMRARLHARGTRLGFYREGSHDLCDAAATGQLAPATGAWIARAQELLAARHATTSGLAAIEIAEDVSGAARACHLELHAGVEPAPFAALAEGLTGLSAQRADRPDVETLAGTPVIVDRLRVTEAEDAPVLELRRDARAFFQGNRFLLEPLVRHVIARVSPGPVIDLYAGVGLFGLACAAAGTDRVTLVEGDPISGADLRHNAEAYPDRTRTKRQSVEQYLAAAPRGRAQAATVILDPPRTGLSKEALAGLLPLAPAHIVYVSCDVATLARDTRALLDAGYRLREVTGFDLFPNTAHVETVAIVDR